MGGLNGEFARTIAATIDMCPLNLRQTMEVRESWFVVPAPNPRAKFTLFCIPFAGGGASYYHEWSRAFTPLPVEVRAVQSPGRETRMRETPLPAIGSLVEQLADAVAPFADKPYVIFGHSMGAIVGFELARTLVLRQKPAPSHLFVSGANAPHVPRNVESLHDLPDDQLVCTLSERYGGIPREVLEHRELRELILPALRADLTAIETYQYREGPRLRCPISACCGIHDAFLTVPNVDLWCEMTEGPFESRYFAGDHFYLNDHRGELIAAIRATFRHLA